MCHDSCNLENPPDKHYGKIVKTSKEHEQLLDRKSLVLFSQRFLQATPPLLNGAFKDNIKRHTFHAFPV